MIDFFHFHVQLLWCSCNCFYVRGNFYLFDGCCHCSTINFFTFFSFSRFNPSWWRVAELMQANMDLIAPILLLIVLST